MARLGQILAFVSMSVVLTTITVSKMKRFRSKLDGSSRIDLGWSRSGRLPGKVIMQSSTNGKHLLQKNLAGKDNFLMTEEEENYVERIEFYSDGLVQSYDHPEQMEAARNVVPIEIRKMIWESQHTKRPPDGSYPEYDAIIKLMQWFRMEFMQWLHYPVCEGNGCEDKIPVRKKDADFRDPRETNQTTKLPILFSNNYVEVWKCTGCDQNIHFRRYTEPKHLLEHRKGRCGEHSILFTFICLALGLEARRIESYNFDHVWTEVYFKSANRWVFCDPSEVVCDTPLIYELAWKRNINMVLAFSNEEVRDVTRRYTHNYQITKRLRTIPERILQNKIKAVNEKRQKNLPESRLMELRKREKKENEELMSPVNIDIMYSTRISSSVEKEKRRGKVNPDILGGKGVTWVFNEEEIKRKRFHLSYSCILDKYDRHTEGLDSKVNKWQNGVLSAESIQRRVTEDSKICSLSRFEGAPKSSISWKFQIPQKYNDMQIDQVEIILPTQKLSINSYISITVFSKNQVYLHRPIIKDGRLTYDTLKTDKFRGESGIWIKTVMASGDWDTTELFTSTQENENNFDVVITLAQRKNV